MSLAIITADQRVAEATVKGQICGIAGVGKTTLLKTCPPGTLAISAEGGMLSVQNDDEFGPRFTGDTIEPSNWLENLAILEGFEQKAPGLAKYTTAFVDSTSIVSKWCFQWCQTQERAFNTSGKPDTRGAYGLLAETTIDWAWRWKRLPGVNVWLVCGLEHKENKVGGKDWLPLMMGAKLAQELPFIMDYVLVMSRFQTEDGRTLTGLFTNAITHPQFGTVPLKTRGGGFDPIERPHLGAFMQKALGLQRRAAPPSAVPPVLGSVAA